MGQYVGNRRDDVTVAVGGTRQLTFLPASTHVWMNPYYEYGAGGSKGMFIKETFQDF